MISRLRVQGESATPAGIFLAANQDEAAVAVFALDKVLIAHLVPDARMTERAAAAIAGDLVTCDHHDFRWVEYIALGGHWAAYSVL
ncbi:hypothetical protein HY17_08480 [Hyphomonas sp. CY54-11-8]|nr:hypothetical protein HY17_08480 [Hyphomonas sp. CY54-11-8]